MWWLRLLSDTGNIDRVGRYGGARVYIPSKVAFDSALPFKMGEDVKVTIVPDVKAILIAPANDQRKLLVIEAHELSQKLEQWLLSTLERIQKTKIEKSQVRADVSRIEKELVFA